MIRSLLSLLFFVWITPYALTANLLICELRPGTDPQQIASDFQIILRMTRSLLLFISMKCPRDVTLTRFSF